MGARGQTTTIATCGTRMEGALKVAALSSAGFDAALGSDDAGGLQPEMGALYCGAYRVIVPSGEAEEAVALMASIDAGEHALADEDGEASAGPVIAIGLDARRRGWALVAVAMLVAFTAYRVIISAVEFGLF